MIFSKFVIPSFFRYRKRKTSEIAGSDTPLATCNCPNMSLSGGRAASISATRMCLLRPSRFFEGQLAPSRANAHRLQAFSMRRVRL